MRRPTFAGRSFSQSGKVLVSFILLAATLLSLGCQNRRNERLNESDLSRAGALIDQGRFDEAISILQPMSESSSEARPRVYLASAYAGRAGLNTFEYWQITKKYQEAIDKEKRLQDADSQRILIKEELSKKAPRWVRMAIPAIDQNLRDFQHLRTQIAILPVLDSNQRADVEKARRILTDTASEGAHLFRAILGIILIRSKIEDSAQVIHTFQQENAGMCSPLVGKLVFHLKNTLDMTAEVLNDLQIAFPSKKAEIAVLSEQNKLSEPQKEQIQKLADPAGRSLCRLATLKTEASQP